MVFLVTKAALAATVIGLGVTFGALSYLARQGQENSNNNGNKGFEISFHPKEPPPNNPQQQQSDCNCKVITECTQFSQTGGTKSTKRIFSFRLGRTCGFQGFQRKVCCDEVQFFSTPPPNFALDEIKSMHAQLTTTAPIIPSCVHKHIGDDFSQCSCDHEFDIDVRGGASSTSGGGQTDEIVITEVGDVADATTPSSSSTPGGNKPKIVFPDLSEYFPKEDMESGTAYPFEAMFRGRTGGIDKAFEEIEATTVDIISSSSPGTVRRKFPSLSEYFPEDNGDASDINGGDDEASSNRHSATAKLSSTTAAPSDDDVSSSTTEISTGEEVEKASLSTNSSTLKPEEDEELFTTTVSSLDELSTNASSSTTLESIILTSASPEDLDETTTMISSSSSTLPSSSSPSPDFPDVTEGIIHGSQRGTQSPQDLIFERASSSSSTTASSQDESVTEMRTMMSIVEMIMSEGHTSISIAPTTLSPSTAEADYSGEVEMTTKAASEDEKLSRETTLPPNAMVSTITTTEASGTSSTTEKEAEMTTEKETDEVKTTTGLPIGDDIDVTTTSEAPISSSTSVSGDRRPFALSVGEKEESTTLASSTTTLSQSSTENAVTTTESETEMVTTEKPASVPETTMIISISDAFDDELVDRNNSDTATTTLSQPDALQIEISSSTIKEIQSESTTTVSEEGSTAQHSSEEPTTVTYGKTDDALEATTLQSSSSSTEASTTARVSSTETQTESEPITTTTEESVEMFEEPDIILTTQSPSVTTSETTLKDVPSESTTLTPEDELTVLSRSEKPTTMSYDKTDEEDKLGATTMQSSSSTTEALEATTLPASISEKGAEATTTEESVEMFEEPEMQLTTESSIISTTSTEAATTLKDISSESQPTTEAIITTLKSEPEALEPTVSNYDNLEATTLQSSSSKTEESTTLVPASVSEGEGSSTESVMTTTSSSISPTKVELTTTEESVEMFEEPEQQVTTESTSISTTASALKDVSSESSTEPIPTTAKTVVEDLEQTTTMSFDKTDDDIPETSTMPSSSSSTESTTSGSNGARSTETATTTSPDGNEERFFKKGGKQTTTESETLSISTEIPLQKETIESVTDMEMSSTTPKAETNEDEAKDEGIFSTTQSIIESIMTFLSSSTEPSTTGSQSELEQTTTEESVEMQSTMSTESPKASTSTEAASPETEMQTTTESPRSLTETTTIGVDEVVTEKTKETSTIPSSDLKLEGENELDGEQPLSFSVKLSTETTTMTSTDADIAQEAASTPKATESKLLSEPVPVPMTEEASTLSPAAVEEMDEKTGSSLISTTTEAEILLKKSESETLMPEDMSQDETTTTSSVVSTSTVIPGIDEQDVVDRGSDSTTTMTSSSAFKENVTTMSSEMPEIGSTTPALEFVEKTTQPAMGISEMTTTERDNVETTLSDVAEKTTIVSNRIAEPTTTEAGKMETTSSSRSNDDSTSESSVDFTTTQRIPNKEELPEMDAQEEATTQTVMKSTTSQPQAVDLSDMTTTSRVSDLMPEDKKVTTTEESFKETSTEAEMAMTTSTEKPRPTSESETTTESDKEPIFSDEPETTISTANLPISETTVTISASNLEEATSTAIPTGEIGETTTSKPELDNVAEVKTPDGITTTESTTAMSEADKDDEVHIFEHTTTESSLSSVSDVAVPTTTTGEELVTEKAKETATIPSSDLSQDDENEIDGVEKSSTVAQTAKTTTVTPVQDDRIDSNSTPESVATRTSPPVAEESTTLSVAELGNETDKPSGTTTTSSSTEESTVITAASKIEEETVTTTAPIPSSEAGETATEKSEVGNADVGIKSDEFETATKESTTRMSVEDEERFFDKTKERSTTESQISSTEIPEPKVTTEKEIPSTTLSGQTEEMGDEGILSTTQSFLEDVMSFLSGSTTTPSLTTLSGTDESSSDITTTSASKSTTEQGSIVEQPTTEETANIMGSTEAEKEAGTESTTIISSEEAQSSKISDETTIKPTSDSKLDANDDESILSTTQSFMEDVMSILNGVTTTLAPLAINESTSEGEMGTETPQTVSTTTEQKSEVTTVINDEPAATSASTPATSLESTTRIADSEGQSEKSSTDHAVTTALLSEEQEAEINDGIVIPIEETTTSGEVMISSTEESVTAGTLRIVEIPVTKSTPGSVTSTTMADELVETTTEKPADEIGTTASSLQVTETSTSTTAKEIDAEIATTMSSVTEMVDQETTSMNPIPSTTTGTSLGQSETETTTVTQSRSSFGTSTSESSQDISETGSTTVTSSGDDVDLEQKTTAMVPSAEEIRVEDATPISLLETTMQAIMDLKTGSSTTEGAVAETTAKKEDSQPESPSEVTTAAPDSVSSSNPSTTERMEETTLEMFAGESTTARDAFATGQSETTIKTDLMMKSDSESTTLAGNEVDSSAIDIQTTTLASREEDDNLPQLDGRKVPSTTTATEKSVEERGSTTLRSQTGTESVESTTISDDDDGFNSIIPASEKTIVSTTTERESVPEDVTTSTSERGEIATSTVKTVDDEVETTLRSATEPIQIPEMTTEQEKSAEMSTTLSSVATGGDLETTMTSSSERSATAGVTSTIESANPDLEVTTKGEEINELSSLSTTPDSLDGNVSQMDEQERDTTTVTSFMTEKTSSSNKGTTTTESGLVSVEMETTTVLATMDETTLRKDEEDDSITTMGSVEEKITVSNRLGADQTTFSPLSTTTSETGTSSSSTETETTVSSSKTEETTTEAAATTEYSMKPDVTSTQKASSDIHENEISTTTSEAEEPITIDSNLEKATTSSPSAVEEMDEKTGSSLISTTTEAEISLKKSESQTMPGNMEQDATTPSSAAATSTVIPEMDEQHVVDRSSDSTTTMTSSSAFEESVTTMSSEMAEMGTTIPFSEVEKTTQPPTSTTGKGISDMTTTERENVETTVSDAAEKTTIVSNRIAEPTTTEAGKMETTSSSSTNDDSTTPGSSVDFTTTQRAQNKKDLSEMDEQEEVTTWQPQAVDLSDMTTTSRVSDLMPEDEKVTTTEESAKEMSTEAEMAMTTSTEMSRPTAKSDKMKVETTTESDKEPIFSDEPETTTSTANLPISETTVTTSASLPISETTVTTSASNVEEATTTAIPTGEIGEITTSKPELDNVAEVKTPDGITTTESTTGVSEVDKDDEVHIFEHTTTSEELVTEKAKETATIPSLDLTQDDENEIDGDKTTTVVIPVQKDRIDSTSTPESGASSPSAQVAEETTTLSAEELGNKTDKPSGTTTTSSPIEETTVSTAASKMEEETVATTAPIPSLEAGETTTEKSVVGNADVEIKSDEIETTTKESTTRMSVEDEDEERFFDKTKEYTTEMSEANETTEAVTEQLQTTTETSLVLDDMMMMMPEDEMGASNETHASYGSTTEYPDVEMSNSTSSAGEDSSTTDSMMLSLMDISTISSLDDESSFPITEITKSIRREPDTDKTVVELITMLSQVKNKNTKSIRREPDTDKTVVELVGQSSKVKNKYTKTVNAIRSGSERSISEYTTEGSDYTSFTATSGGTLLEGMSTTEMPANVSATDSSEGGKTTEIPDVVFMADLMTEQETAEVASGGVNDKVVFDVTTDGYLELENRMNATEIPEQDDNSTLVVESGTTIGSELEVATENNRNLLIESSTSSSLKQHEEQTKSPELVFMDDDESMTEQGTTFKSEVDTESANETVVFDPTTGVYLQIDATELPEDYNSTMKVESATRMGSELEVATESSTSSSSDVAFMDESLSSNGSVTTLESEVATEGMNETVIFDTTTEYFRFLANASEATTMVYESPEVETEKPVTSAVQREDRMFIAEDVHNLFPETTTNRISQEVTNMPVGSSSSTVESTTMDGEMVQTTMTSFATSTSKQSTTTSTTFPSPTTTSTETTSAQPESEMGQTETEPDIQTSTLSPENRVIYDDEEVTTESSTMVDYLLNSSTTSLPPSTTEDPKTTAKFLQEIYDNFFGPAGRSARIDNLDSGGTTDPVSTTPPTTTAEPPFTVEVKVGPYDSRSLFASSSTAEEKQLEGQISNVVSQLLLTTHKNFHLLPSFVECAAARGGRGRRKTRVLHFDTENYPWMARVGFREPGGITFPCAGTIISRRYVLTSAHCATRRGMNNSNPYLMEVLLEGAKNAAIGLPPLLRYKYKVEEVVPHPNYNVTSRENDLALIRLSAEIPFNTSSEIKPICLPFEDGYGVWDALPKDGETAYLGGWGYGLKNMAAQIEEMEQAAVTIWPKDNCTHSYRGDRAKKITPKHICAYGKAEKDACRGDNGGPLMALMTRQRIFFQIGIVSYGPRCGYGVPGVYTRVSEYLSWILDTMDP